MNPIKTAPKDGRPVLVTCSTMGLSIYSFRARFTGQRWVLHAPGDVTDGKPFSPEPTFWLRD